MLDFIDIMFAIILGVFIGTWIFSFNEKIIFSFVFFAFRGPKLAKQYIHKKRERDLLRKKLDQAIVSPFSSKLDISQSLRDLKTLEQELVTIQIRHNKLCKFANRWDRLIP